MTVVEETSAIEESPAVEEPVIEDTSAEEATPAADSEQVSTDQHQTAPPRPVRASNDPREVKRRNREAVLRAQGVSISSSQSQDTTDGSSSSSS